MTGGDANRVLLYADLPADFTNTPPQPCAKAARGRTLTLSHPFVDADGCIHTSAWIRVHIMDPSTSKWKLFWVTERAEDGTPA